MKRWSGLLATVLGMVVAGSYFWTHSRHAALAKAPLPTAAQEDHPKYAEEEAANQMVNVTGPMADYMTRGTSAKIETLQPIAYKPTAADRVGDSPVGTSRAILHRTFGVASAVDVPFELPAHASTPQLRGSYSAFLQTPGSQASGREGSVEFLLLDEQQYADFLNGRPGDALFSAEATNNGGVNVKMPPTMSKPVKYYLVFRSDSGKKQAVQADFQIDF